MSYANVMVHVQPGRSNEALLAVACDLAIRFRASVTGIAGCQPMQIDYYDNCVDANLIDIDRQLITDQLHAAEAEFRTALKTLAGALGWRSRVSIQPVAEYVAREARDTDLIITGADSTSVSDFSRRADTRDLLMRAGRPVLVVPHHATSLKLHRVVVFWSDSRETRRAIADALPLLMKASAVIVAMIVPANEMLAGRTYLDAVVAWLARHGVESRSMVARAEPCDAVRLKAIADEQQADLVVAGAYGHSRFHEWALGGITRDLLLHSDHCALLSH